MRFRKKIERNDGREFLKGKAALKEFVRESEFIYDAVSTTLGAGGRNILIKDGFEEPIIQKDGKTVADRVSTIKDMDAAAIVLRNAAKKTDRQSGDGTTSTVVLGYHLLKKGAKEVLKGANPIKIKTGIDIAVSEVCKDLTKEAKEGNIYDVAMVSTNNDEELSDMVTQAYDAVGKDGMVYIQQVLESESTIDIAEGIVLDKGWMFPIYSNGGKETVLEDCLIMLVDDLLDKTEKLPYYVNYSKAVGKPLLLIISQIGHNVNNFFYSNRKNQAPVFVTYAPLSMARSQHRTQLMEDLAIITGGKVISGKNANISDLGIKSNVSEQDKVMSCGKMLGVAKKVVIGKDKTVIVPNPSKAATEHIESIDTKDEWNEERKAIISGKMATIKLGGNSDVEQGERFTRLEDAVHSVKAAMKEGVVVGGGMALYRLKHKKHNLEGYEKDIVVGYNLLYSILDSVANKVASNARFDIEDVYHAYSEGCVLNVRTGYYEPIQDTVIIDPLTTVKNALINSSSAVGTLLTTEIYCKFN